VGAIFFDTAKTFACVDTQTTQSCLGSPVDRIVLGAAAAVAAASVAAS